VSPCDYKHKGFPPAMASPSEFKLEVAALSDVGTEREHNEDCCGCGMESEASGVVAVADGVSSSAGGEVASQMAIAAVLRTYRELPATMSSGKRLWRAVQQANIDTYESSLVVPELRGMATTLTAIAVDKNELAAAHIGDSRLYLVRAKKITQLTKDHTVAAERVRMKLLTEKAARHHPGRSTLTKSLGRELIASIDRITLSLVDGDTLILCSDGLYNVLEDGDLERISRGTDAATACRLLIEVANGRGTPDNVTVAVVRMKASPSIERASPNPAASLFQRIFRSRR
jgi:PPM family protein phosphatase